MNVTAKSPFFRSAFVLLTAASGFTASLPLRPPAGQGPDAKTLLVYSDTRTRYSLGDAVAAMKLQLLRVDTKLETIAADAVTPRQVAAADYVVVFCPQASPALSKPFLQSIADTRRPVLWVGYGAERLEKLPPFQSEFAVSAEATATTGVRVHYRGEEWPVPVTSWVPAALDPLNSSNSTVLMSTRGETGGSPVELPICWRTGHATFFVGVPASDAMNFLLADLVLDFYGVKETRPAQVFVRIDDYHCRRNHREFRRIVDYLYSAKRPFILSVIPAFQDAETGKVEELDAQPEFIETLRYAQARGARLIVQGYTHAYQKGTCDSPEFWDAGQDAPIAEDCAGYASDRAARGVRALLRHGLFPLGWQTPGYAASGRTYQEVGAIFSTGVERVPLSRATSRELFAPSGFTLDGFGRFIVPENMGFVRSAAPNATETVQTTAAILTKLRGTVAGCYIHSYQPLESVVALTEALDQHQTAWLDLAELDHWVQLPDTLLLTGNAERTVTARRATVRWRAFNRAGDLVEEKQEPVLFSGERVFKRRGVGDYELFEFIESKS
jgi:uncharacterized protein YdaL